MAVHSTRPAPRRKRPQRTSHRTRQIVLLTIVALIVIFGVRGLMFRGNVAPGVTVAGIDIGGLDPATARAHLLHELGPRLEQNVNVTLDEESADMVPAELDAKIDAQKTIDEAMQMGRVASFLLPFFYRADITPSLAIPARPRIPATLRIVAEPPRSATVRIVDGTASVTPARNGRSISARTVLLSATYAALAGKSRLTLTSKAVAPTVSTEEARQAAGKAEELAAGPITVVVDGRRAGILSTAALAASVAVKERDGKATVVFDPKRLQPFLGQMLASKLRDPVNAIWDSDGTKAWVIPAKNGQGFDPETAAAAVGEAALATGSREATITLAPIEPARTTADAQAFGITTMVSGITTDLGDSAENRIINVDLMAKILDLRLVLPGNTFSFNDAVGPRTPERGFKEGMAIVGGLLLPSIGGGVCQVATTLFDAAFQLGLAIVERHNHGLYIDHYGLGMDAAVSWDGPDFQFKNNTAHPILIRATADASTMTVNLYSAPVDSRTVTSSVTDRYAPVKAKARYFDDAYAPPKKVEKIVDGSDGFSVDVHRTVTKDGETLSEDTFYSTYTPQDEIWLLGPGAFPPGDNIAEAPPEGWVSPYGPAK